MHSHISIVRNGVAEYIYEISQQACEKIHTTGTLNMGNAHIISGLRVNDSITHSITFTGFINSDGRCNGASYSDPYGTWESAVVQGTVKITLFQYKARVALESDQIHLRSGTVCSLSTKQCIDMEGGYTFWDPLPRDNCKFNQYGVLYEGYANKMISIELGSSQTIYSLSTQDITFALTAKNKESVCGYTVIRTEHPKLVIFETKRGDTFANSKHVTVSNLDIFAYVNSKFVYVEKHLRTQMKQLYYDVITQRCNLEKQTLENALTIATQAPDEFAFHLMKSPGYMAVVAGEVVHIVKCVPVEVKIEHGDKCYSELQVQHKNSTFFLTPRTHILKTIGTEVACNALLPSHYYIGDAWYKILPRPTEALAPVIIKPLTKPTWKYTSPADLATSGIYTNKDLNDLRDHIMFPVERTALLNDIAREMNGIPVSDNDGTINKLLNEDAITKIASTAWERAWSKFTGFGNICAGILAIFVAFQFIKAVINMIINGYALHSVFGWSAYILGALCSALAHTLLRKHRHTTDMPQADVEKSIELQEVQTEQPTVQPRTEVQVVQEASSSGTKNYLSL